MLITLMVYTRKGRLLGNNKQNESFRSSTCWNWSSGCCPNDGNTTNGEHSYRNTKSDKTRTPGNTSGPAGNTSRNKANTVVPLPSEPLSRAARLSSVAADWRGPGGSTLNRASTILGCVGPTRRAPPSSRWAVTTEPRMAGSSSDPTSSRDKTPPSGYLCPLLLSSSPQYFHWRPAIVVSREGKNHATVVGFPSPPPLGCQSLARKLHSAGIKVSKDPPPRIGR
jgi:hypothetical protein